MRLYSSSINSTGYLKGDLDLREYNIDSSRDLEALQHDSNCTCTQYLLSVAIEFTYCSPRAPRTDCAAGRY